MEIIHLVLGKANPNRLNGVNKVVYQMASEQTSAGKNVSVWGITKELCHDYPERNFKTLLFKACKNPFFIHSSLKKIILEHENAIFHLHGGWIPEFSTLARFFAKNNIKYVLTPHGAYNTIAMKRSFFIKKIYFLLFEKPLLQNALKIHSIGLSEVEGLELIYPNNKSFLLPYGFVLPEVATKIKSQENFIVGFMGRIDVYTKGLDVLLEAFLQFQKNKQHVLLWIIGDGEGMSFITDFIQKNKMSNVILFGKQFGIEKNNLIAQMTAFAHPSRNEGLPTAVLEAASFGVPSIVTKATNVASYIEKYSAGVTIETSSVDELLKAINTMYADRMNDYSKQCKSMLVQEFSWNILVHKYDDLYLN